MKSLVFNFPSSVVTKLVENIKIDFPQVDVKIVNADLPHESGIKMSFYPSGLLEEKLHYYIIGYNAHILNGEK